VDVSDDLTAALRAGRAAPLGDAPARAAGRLGPRAEREGLLDVAYATVDSPLGPLLAAGTRRGLAMLEYKDDRTDALLELLAVRISPRILEAPARLDPVRRELEEYFEGRRTRFEVPIDWVLVRGFAASVLRQTSRIPYGGASTYAEIAAAAGSPRAHRAAGNALSSNPMPIVVPCHRVLHSGGGIGGYTGGLQRKRYLLDLEAGRLSA
jgi:methylated-DNA-[protein]-cysteine S-methyltransferase